MAWKLQCSVPSRIYQRPLGRNELGFYWDSQFNGTADTVQHSVVESLGSPGCFDVENVSRTWRTLKSQYPLLGSHIEEHEDDSQMKFVVAEHQLQYCGPEEVTFRSVASLEEAKKVMDDMVNGRRLLSNKLLARIVILTRTDVITHVHVFFHVAHCITDGMANATLLRSFLDILSSPPTEKYWDLQERLALALSSDELIPGRINRARLRWHRAIGLIISFARASRITGGHTLPRTFSSLTPYTPARSGLIAFSFPPELSTRIVANCRSNQLTFGNAFPVIAQVALTRLLCRRYLSGQIDTDEWEYRKREPMVTGGPLNLRPFLDHDWYQQGGHNNVSLSIGFFFLKLPFMPLGSAANLTPGDALPGFLDLLSFSRFLLRSRSIKRQSAIAIEHPLFLHISGSRSQSIVQRQEVARAWEKKQGKMAPMIPVREQSPVFSHGGSSIGNMDGLIPRRYPLDRDESTFPRLFLHTSETKLHCRPAELYLGASTTRQQLHLNIFWDMNVYDEDTIKEWMDEVQQAIEVFLGTRGGAADKLHRSHL